MSQERGGGGRYWVGMGWHYLRLYSLDMWVWLAPDKCGSDIASLSVIRRVGVLCGWYWVEFEAAFFVLFSGGLGYRIIKATLVFVRISSRHPPPP